MILSFSAAAFCEIAAAAFGQCKNCGKSKLAHRESSARVRSPPKKMVGKSSPAFLNSGGSGKEGACDQYRVDITAAAFGQCVCGKPKNAHVILSGTKSTNVVATKKARILEQHPISKAVASPLLIIKFE